MGGRRVFAQHPSCTAAARPAGPRLARAHARSDRKAQAPLLPPKQPRQALGRHSSALKSYERALELDPARLYCLAQAGALLYMSARYADSAERYRAALQLQPSFPAAQLGLAETLLAAARLHARMGAAGAAADELREAAQQASACARGAGGAHMVTAWKLLGDVLSQHAAVALGGPLAAPAAGEGPEAGAAAAGAAARGLGTKLVAMRAARRAYLRALHLEPSSGPLWGDLACSCHREARLLRLQASAGADADLDAEARGAAAAARAERLVKGGLRLAPAEPWLWRQLGAVSQDPAAAEYSFSRWVVSVSNLSFEASNLFLKPLGA
jgi:tetratricopeptide (TPR) repeat protein